MNNKKLISCGFVFLLLILVLSGCTQTTQDNQNPEKEEKTPGEEYQWSNMNEGPYRDKISFATSTDLFNWTDSEIVLAEHASVPGAVIKNGVIYVYFVDVSEDGIAERIGLITSNDNGITWSEKQFCTFTDIGDEVPVDPALYLLDDGSIRLYYYDINEQRTLMSDQVTNKIYSAVSTDGSSFVQEDGVRFERIGIFDPDVINVGDVWRMYVGDIENNQVISATSSDGLVFVEEGVALNGGAVPDGFYKDDLYYLYTAGISSATSADGATFTSTPYSFHSNIGMVTADPSVIELPDGTYMMLYKTKS